MKSVFKSIVVPLLSFEARLVLRKYRPYIVAVTGSVGKTTAKDAIFSVLAGSRHVRKSEKSFNSEIGLPLAILGCPNAWRNPLRWIANLLFGFSLILVRRPFPEILVLEVGVDRPGDMRRLSSWLHPDTVVVTRLARVPVHVEFFESPEEVIREKGELVSALRPGGTLIVNADDDDALSFRSLLREGRVVTFGTSPKADVRASHYEVMYEKRRGRSALAGITFRIDYGGNSIPVSLPGVLGMQHLYPALSALAVGISFNLNMVSMAEGLAARSPTPGRMRILEGIKDSTVIDDSYNSSPVALEEALGVLGDLRASGRKIAVLGDMLELGRFSAEEHRKAGGAAAERADVLYAVGIRARGIADGAQDAGMDERKIFQFDTAEEAGRELQNFIKAGDLVLVKGSQGIRLERAVEAVMAHPEDAPTLLVRQDAEWKLRP